MIYLNTKLLKTKNFKDPTLELFLQYITYKFNIDDPIVLFPVSIWSHLCEVLIKMECTHICDIPTCYLLHCLYPTKEGIVIISHGKSICWKIKREYIL